MKKKTLSTILLIFVVSICKSSSEEIDCENIKNHYKWGQTCIMYQTTEINFDDVELFLEDVSMRGINFHNNRKINYLPVKVDRNFPNLLGYFASFCSLTSVSKLNFQGLIQLTWLSLSNNQIASVANNTFEDLIMIESLYLHNNRIKFLHGSTFNNLKNLKEVQLRFNFCINEDFLSLTDPTELERVVTEKCASAETNVTDDGSHESYQVNNCEQKSSKSELSGCSGVAFEISSKIKESEARIMNQLKILRVQNGASNEMTSEEQEKICSINEKRLSENLKVQTQVFAIVETWYQERLEQKGDEIAELKIRLSEAEERISEKILEIERLKEDSK